MGDVVGTIKQKKRIRKRIVSTVIAIAFAMSFAPAVFAADSTVGSASDLNSALMIGTISAGDKITLSSSITTGTEFDITVPGNGNLTIDGGGNSITSTRQDGIALVIQGGNVTLSNITISGEIIVDCDSTLNVGPGVTISNATPNSTTIDLSPGTLNISGATISGSHTGVIARGATSAVNISSGTVSGRFYGLGTVAGAKVLMSGGTIQATDTSGGGVGISSSGDDNTVIDIRGGTISGETAINANGLYSVSNVLYDAANPPTVKVSGSPHITGGMVAMCIGQGAKADITGGIISATNQYGTGIYSFGGNNTSVAISGGTISGNTGIRVSGKANTASTSVQCTPTPVLNISGTASITGGAAGIDADSGATVNISGGSVHATAPNSFGITGEGDYHTAINISNSSVSGDTGIYVTGQYYDNSAWVQAAQPPVLSISGNTNITGEHHYGISATNRATVQATSGIILGKLQSITNDNTCTFTTTGATLLCGNNPPNANLISIKLTQAGGGSVEIPIALNHNRSTYNIDIPGNLNAFYINPVDDPNNAVGTVAVKSVNTYGSSGSYSNYAEFISDTGSIVIKADVTLCYNNQLEIFPITLNLFQPKFNGITVTPDVIAGEWEHTFFSLDYGSAANVFVGASKVRLTLPVSTNNQVSSFVVTGIEDDDGNIVPYQPNQQPANDYTIPLSTSLTYETKVHITETLASDGSQNNVVLTVTKLALSSGSWLYANGDYIAKVKYTSDPSFVINNPTLLVVYYHDDGNGMKMLTSKTFSLPAYNPSSPVTTIEIATGNTNNSSPDDPNLIAAFLISGDTNINSTVFGGVKYGGAGWYETLPNH